MSRYLLLLFLFMSGLSCAQEQTVVVGSKKFTESVILGEMARQLLGQDGTPVEHRRELGGTRVLWKGLLTGEIDLYPEYTGTLMNEIFAGRHIETLEQLEIALAAVNIYISKPLGFNNTYVLGMREQDAGDLDIVTISDLARYPDLRFGFSNEFVDRLDGWRRLRGYYRLPHENVTGLDHDLAYRGLESGTLDVIDLYSTDAEIRYYKIRPLIDDEHYFPDYLAVYLYRADFAVSHPHAIARLAGLEGRIKTPDMVSLNAEVKIGKQPEALVAAQFLQDRLALDSEVERETRFDRFIRNTLAHLLLVGISLLAAILCGIPLGIFSVRHKTAGQFILGIAGILQTIPSLALFVFMIPLLGIGGPPAVVTLFLYSLLPIIRNTHSGLQDIPLSVRESAIAIGLPARARLIRVELPLATRSILAGIKTSAVINVGTATLGALIGAGGYGQPILTGIRLDDMGLILEGAVPAAVLALLVQGLFDLIEKKALPKGINH